MPSRNAKKTYDAHAYYHVYNRGVDKRVIFHDDEDYDYFLQLIARYLDQPSADKSGRQYDWLGDDIEVIAYCLMPNHFHLLLYQIDPEAMTKLLRAVSGSYTVYYNKKYDRSGALFQGVYRASHIDNEAYLQYITRYIHLNPKRPFRYRWSSLGDFIGKSYHPWLKSNGVVGQSASEQRRYYAYMQSWDAPEDEMLEYLADH